MTVPVVSVVGHLRKGHRGAQHVPGELLSAPGILGPDAHLVVHRETTVAPAEQAAAQFLGQRVLAREKRAHRAPKALKEQRLGHRRQGDKRCIGQERPVGAKHVHVRVEVGQVARSSPLVTNNYSLDKSCEEFGATTIQINYYEIASMA